jgi:predicted transcriptional regulator
MTISLQLDEEQSKRLQAMADQLHVDPSLLAKAAINDMISRPADDFSSAASRVLEKNQELYRRLS